MTKLDQEIKQAQTLGAFGMDAQKEVDRLMELRDKQAKQHTETFEEWGIRIAMMEGDRK
jgi:hypothetical protein